MSDFATENQQVVVYTVNRKDLSLTVAGKETGFEEI